MAALLEGEAIDKEEVKWSVVKERGHNIVYIVKEVKVAQAVSYNNNIR
jgi:hypothetical protein